MATELVTQEAKTTSGKIAQWMGNGQIDAQIAGALGGYMDCATFKNKCILAARDPILANCNPASLFAAFLTCAQIGLLPGKHDGHAYLIPRAGNVDVMPGFAGYLYLMRRQKGVKAVQVKLVHESDDFAWDADTETITHRFDPFAEGREFKMPDGNGNGGCRGGYLRAEMADGSVIVHFVPIAKIKKAMNCAQSKNVWKSWFAEMALKTVVRDAWARRVIAIDPEQSERVGKVLALDDATLGNDPRRVVEATVEAPETPTAEVAQLDPAEVCPKCGAHEPELKGKMADGCPNCSK